MYESHFAYGNIWKQDEAKFRVEESIKSCSFTEMWDIELLVASQQKIFDHGWDSVRVPLTTCWHPQTYSEDVNLLLLLQATHTTHIAFINFFRGFGQQPL